MKHKLASTLTATASPWTSYKVRILGHQPSSGAETRHTNIDNISQAASWKNSSCTKVNALSAPQLPSHISPQNAPNGLVVYTINRCEKTWLIIYRVTWNFSLKCGSWILPQSLTQGIRAGLWELYLWWWCSYPHCVCLKSQQRLFWIHGTFCLPGHFSPHPDWLLWYKTRSGLLPKIS